MEFFIEVMRVLSNHADYMIHTICKNRRSRARSLVSQSSTTDRIEDHKT